MAKTETSKTVLTVRSAGEYRKTFAGVVTEVAPGISTHTANNTVSYGDNYPDWRMRLATNQQCTTSLSGTKHIMVSKPYKFIVRSVPKDGTVTPTLTTYYEVYGDAPLTVFTTSDNVVESKADNQAKTRFLRDIKSKRTSMNGGVFLGELRQTIRMVKRPASALQNGVRGYLQTAKKRAAPYRNNSPRRRVRNLNRMLADTWLEYSFGWKPLLHDIDDATDALAKLRETNHGSPVSGKGTDEFRHPATKTNLFTGGPHNINYVAQSTERKVVVYRGWVGVAGTPTARVRFGLTLEEFVPTVWELVPWSFLADYFTNIGDLIESVTTSTAGLRWAAKTVITESEWTCNNMSNTVQADTSTIRRYSTSSPGTSRSLKRTVSRDTYIGSLVPSFQLELPGQSNKWWNIAALIASGKAMQPLHRR